MHNRLFLGNFQVALLKKWVEKDERDDMSHPDDTNEQVLPSADTSAMSTLRKRNHA
jgi:sodium/bile acid cotransporter 7